MELKKDLISHFNCSTMWFNLIAFLKPGCDRNLLLCENVSFE